MRGMSERVVAVMVVTRGWKGFPGPPRMVRRREVQARLQFEVGKRERVARRRGEGWRGNKEQLHDGTA